MLVDVVELRRRGVRLSEEQVRAVRPARGLLRLRVEHSAWHATKERAPLIALLLDEGGAARTVLEPIGSARVVEIGNRGMLIIGLQEERRGRRAQEHRQAWWVRLPET